MIPSINELNNKIIYSKNNIVNNNGNSKEINDPKNNTGLSNKAKYMIGATTLAGAIAFGIIGHKNNWWRKAAQQTEKFQDNTQETIPETLPELKQITIDNFKKIGTFVKGKAKLNNGELFTGTITKQNSIGNNLHLEYENGFLKTSSIFEQNNLQSVKKYSYDDNGRIIKVLLNNSNESRYSYNKDSGKIIEFTNGTTTKKFYCDENGKVKYIDGYEFKNTAGNRVNKAITEFDTTTGKPKIAYKPQNSTVYEFDSNGKILRTIKTAPGFSKQAIIEQGAESSLAGTVKKLDVLKYHEKDYNLEWTRSLNSDTDLILENIHMKKDGKQFHLEKADNKWSIYSNGYAVEFNDDIADISFKLDNCARYNTKTQELEILPEFKESGEEITKRFNEIISAAKTAKQTIRKTYKYQKANEEFANTLKNEGII